MLMTGKIIKGERRYGCWAGDPEGNPEDKDRCVAEAYDRSGFGHFYQCLRKRGHGPDGLYCKQHAKMVEKEKRDGTQQI